MNMSTASYMTTYSDESAISSKTFEFMIKCEEIKFQESKMFFLSFAYSFYSIYHHFRDISKKIINFYGFFFLLQISKRGIFINTPERTSTCSIIQEAFYIRCVQEVVAGCDTLPGEYP